MRPTFLRAFASSALLVAFLFCAAGAHADDSVGNDEVRLKNGGSIRGTVVASEPGTSVTILEVGQKESRVVSWDDVSGVERGKFTPPPPAPGAALVPGTPGVVKLHVDSRVPVGIYKHRDSYGATSRGQGIVLDTPRLVCTSPCDVLLDGRLDREFSVAGDHAVESDRFQLGGLTGDQSLLVSPGSPGLRTAGSVLLGMGFTAVGLGTLGAIGGAIGTSPNPHGKGFIQNKGLEIAGFVTIGAGVAAIVGGILAIAESGTTIQLRPAGVSAERKPRYWAGEF